MDHIWWLFYRAVENDEVSGGSHGIMPVISSAVSRRLEIRRSSRCSTVFFMSLHIQR